MGCDARSRVIFCSCSVRIARRCNARWVPRRGDQATADADEKDNEYLLEDLLLQIALWGAQNKQFSPLHTTDLITCICHLAYVQLCTCTVHGSRRCTGEATGGSAPWRHRPEMIIFHAPRARRRAAPGATQMLRPDSEVAA